MLQVSVPGYQTHVASITIRPGVDDAFNVSLTRLLGTLQVRVVDAATGGPIEDATVSYRVGEGLPCADVKLLVPLKRSRLYGVVRPRVAELRPVDSWLQDELHFFVSRLHPPDGVVLPEPPLAVFAMHPAATEPLSAVIVTPRLNDQAAEVLDLQSHGTRPLCTDLGSIPVSLGPDDADGRGSSGGERGVRGRSGRAFEAKVAHFALDDTGIVPGTARREPLGADFGQQA